MSIDAFVELHSRFEFGTISHALCAAIRSLLKVILILYCYIYTLALMHAMFQIL
jgi:gamma-tubulin complex component 2